MRSFILKIFSKKKNTINYIFDHDESFTKLHSIQKPCFKDMLQNIKDVLMLIFEIDEMQVRFLLLP